MKPPGFGPLVIDLSGLDYSRQIRLTSDHELRRGGLIGHGQARVVANELLIEGVISSATAAGREVLALAKDGLEFEASVGVQVLERRDFRKGDVVTSNGRTVTAGPEGLVLITKGRLLEVAIVGCGADAGTQVRIAASRRATHKEIRMDGNDVRVAERARLKEIDDLCKGVEGVGVKELRAQAVAEEIGLDDLRAGLLIRAKNNLELAEIRGRYPHPVDNHIPESGGHPAKALAANLLCRSGHEGLAVKCYGPAVAEAGRKAASNLCDLCAQALRLEGVELPTARHEMIRAAFSTAGLPGLLGDSAAKILAQEYSEAPASWKGFAKSVSVPNFHPHSVYRALHGGNLSQLPPTGEIKHGTVAEEDMGEIGIATYAKMLRVSRQMVIDDDLSVFSDALAAHARAARRTLSDLIYRVLLANAGGAFFHANHANLLTGGTSVLALAGLDLAVGALRRQTDGEGNVLDLAPAVLLVPVELEGSARGLLSSAEISFPAAAAATPTGNVFQNLAALAVEARLSNVEFVGKSSTAWYLFAGPSAGAVCVAYLDGRDTPTLESFGLEASPDFLGLSWRVYHDFGAALIDHRGGVKSNGA
jgi:hypothetical protein